MKIKTLILGLLLSIATFVQLASAQQPGKVSRIGYLSGASESGSGSLIAGFRQGLRDYGYTEGKNILVEYRFAEGKVDRIRLSWLNSCSLMSTRLSPAIFRRSAPPNRLPRQSPSSW
jgi:hypothetical protein